MFYQAKAVCTLLTIAIRIHICMCFDLGLNTKSSNLYKRWGISFWNQVLGILKFAKRRNILHFNWRLWNTPYNENLLTIFLSMVMFYSCYKMLILQLLSCWNSTPFLDFIAWNNNDDNVNWHFGSVLRLEILELEKKCGSNIWALRPSWTTDYWWLVHLTHSSDFLKRKLEASPKRYSQLHYLLVKLSIQWSS